MGHQRLGVLPRSRDWQQVIALITEGAEVEVVAAATSRAAETSMIDASADPAVRRAFWLLTQLPLAARQDDFAGALGRIGLFGLPAQPSLADVTSGIMDAIDAAVRRSRGRTDFGEMAQLCAAESLVAVAGSEFGDLFGTTSNQVKSALAGLGTVKQFSVLARDYVARLARRHLSYFLSRTLSNHVGPGRRFSSVREHRSFEEALDLHCRETTRIIKEFSGEWYSKRTYEGGIDEEQAGRFVHAAFQKVREEFRHRRKADHA
jgi:hypothetical protein